MTGEDIDRYTCNIYTKPATPHAANSKASFSYDENYPGRKYEIKRCADGRATHRTGEEKSNSRALRPHRWSRRFLARSYEPRPLRTAAIRNTRCTGAASSRINRAPARHDTAWHRHIPNPDNGACGPRIRRSFPSTST